MTNKALIEALGPATAGAVEAITDRLAALEDRMVEATTLAPGESNVPVTMAHLEAAKKSGISAIEYNRLVSRYNKQIERTNALLSGSDTAFKKDDIPSVEDLLARLASLERAHTDLAASIYGSPDLAALLRVPGA